MKKTLLKKAAAVVLAFSICGGAVCSPIGEKVIFSKTITANAAAPTFDPKTGTLTLSGNVVKEDVQKWANNEQVKNVVCKEGTVFPQDCGALFGGINAKEFDLSNADTSQVTDMCAMFQGCSEAESIDLSNFDTSKVTDMSCMFSMCYSLKAIDLSRFDTRNVENFMGMFAECKTLTYLDLSAFDTRKATTIDSMFWYCQDLRFLNISHFDTSKVKSMRQMVRGCSSLNRLNLSSFDTGEVEEMSWMFKDCSELHRIFVSDKWTIKSLNEIYDSDLFSGCVNLEGGNGTKYDEKYVDKKRAFIDTDDHPGYLTSFHSPLAKISIADDVAVNIIVNIIDHVSSAKLSGPNGDIIITDFSDKNENGDVILSYPVNATQFNDKITITLYGNNSDQEDDADIIYQTNYSIKDYIDASSEYISDDKALTLIKALDNYGKAAENYFNGTHNVIEGINDISAEDVKDYALPTDKDLKLSLVLNSATALRIYTDSKNVEYNGNKLASKVSKYGTYYEIDNIFAQKLSDKYTVVIDGKEYSISPLTYVYKVLSNKNSSPALVDMAKAIYVYAKAAKDYKG